VKIGILGGTGKLGLAAAVRFRGSGHSVMIGSRDMTRATEAASSIGAGILSGTNLDSARWCDTVFLSVPYSGHRALVETVRDELRGKIIIDATVPIDPANLFQIKTESGKSAAEETQSIISDADVFAGFQTVSHRILRQLDAVHDVLVAGASRRKLEVMDLIRSVELNPIDAGAIEIAGCLERMTVLLLSINKANKVKESGIKITGI
jgi:8-hydroxy-5-deazaflavin:NADPH oxidoreductase